VLNDMFFRQLPLQVPRNNKGITARLGRTPWLFNLIVEKVDYADVTFHPVDTFTP